ncbi:MAG: hypothetical protein RBR71_13345 [Gudongella sp.]|nr:hypothetical protein [Gudongella sp.]
MNQNVKRESKRHLMVGVAIAMAFMMLAIPLTTNESDAAPTAASSTTSTGLGEFNIYFQVSSAVTLPNAVYGNSYLSGVGSGWVGYTGEGYNAYLATLDVLTDAGMAAGTYSFNNTYQTNSPGYWTIDMTYGTMTKLLDLETDSTYSWYVYMYDATSGTPAWVSIGSSAALGFYKPYSDYTVASSAYQTANIAFYYGEAAPVSLPSSGMKTITSVPQTSGSSALISNYTYYFNFTYSGNPGDDVSIDIVGYGSDAYTALVNGLGAMVVGGNASTASYGWLTSIFGIGTVQTAGADTPDDWTDDVYSYWSLDYYDNVSGYTYSQYTTGFYTSLSNGPMVCNNFQFVYA